MKRLFFILFIVSIFGISNRVNAQDSGVNLQEPIPTEVNVDISPEVPGPNDQVIVSITSYGTNLDVANIEWKVNGKIIKSGTGIKDFDFFVGDMNTTTTLEITEYTQEGERLTQSYQIKPSSVDLIWQTQSFVPPFYKGKAMFSHQNNVTFIAVPHITSSSGGEISPKTLIYKWSKNGQVDGGSSGYGKDTYTFEASLISRPLNIVVEVSSQDGGIGKAKSYIVPDDPSIIFYKKNPLYGIEFQNALSSNVELKDSKEITLIAMPYFFGVNDLASTALIYNWSINSVPINDSLNSATRVFRKKEGTSGTSYISTEIDHKTKILQTATGGFNLKFTSPSTEQTGTSI